jgi:hypothetical protein
MGIVVIYTDDAHVPTCINISGTPVGGFMFQAKQIGTLLGIKNVCNTTRDFCEAEKQKATVETARGAQSTVLLTEPGLFRLLHTSRKPSAVPFRQWIMAKLSELRQKHVDEQMEVHAREISRLSTENESLGAKNAVRLKHAFALGDAVYIETNTALNRYCKVGEGENLNIRAKSYMCHDPHSSFVHHVFTKNRKLLEGATHHILRTHAVLGKRDTFDLPVDTVREVLDTLQAFLDGAAENIHVAHEFGLRDRMQTLLDDMNAFAAANTPTRHTGHVVAVPRAATVSSASSYGAVDDAGEKSADGHAEDDGDTGDVESIAGDADEDAANDGPPATNTAPPNDPGDYDAFFRECFDRVEESNVRIVDVRSRHLLWSRATGTHQKTLNEYLERVLGHRKSHTMYDPVTESTNIVVRGLSMHPLQPLVAPGSTLTEFDRFASERLVARVNARVACKDVNREFCLWMRARIGDYNKMTPKDRIDYRRCMNATCLYATLSVGGRTRGGFYGAALVDHPTETSGLKLKHGNRASVEEFDRSDPTIIMRTFGSMSEAARECGVTISAISMSVSTRRPLKGRYFRKTT